jgi:flagellar hook-associated protein 2
MYSGIDTEGLVQQLVEAKRLKVTKATKDQSRITYQQDAWKDLNSKLKNLKSKFDNLRFSSAYAKMTTEVSDSSIASVVTSDGAMKAAQTLEVNKLAKAGYMTGAELKASDGSKVTSGTKLSDLGIETGSEFSITVGGKEKKIQIKEGMTVGSLTNALSSAGVNAKFDSATQRIFIGSKDTGKAYDFNLTASDENGNKALAALGLTSESYSYKEGSAVEALKGGDAGSKTLGSLTGSSFSELGLTVNGKRVTFDSDMTVDDFLAKLKENGVDASLDQKTGKISFPEGSVANRGTSGEALLSALGLGADQIETKTVGGGAAKVDGQDAEISLNGATFTSNSNTFNVNGLTITAKAETQVGRPVTLNTTKDTSAIYDTVKDVVKAYSELINEMDKLYNADTKTKYDPLTDEEKSAMTEYEIEKWEEKLKEQVLAKDSTIGNLSNSFSAIMSQGFEIGGKTMYLFDFGIETASYFNAPDNEKNALHIKGDEDDSLFANETNKLKEMIASDPDAVSSFFAKLSDAMYKKMDELSSKVPGYRSYGNFFEDTRLKSDYDDYKTKIEDMEKKLSDYEDKWYNRFAKMETAMAKMQSNQNAISGLFGGS